MAWTPITGSLKSILEGVEFGMTNGTLARRCFISQQEIDKWAGHVGAIDQNIAAAWRVSCGPIGLNVFMPYGTRLLPLTSATLDETQCKDLVPAIAKRVQAILDGQS